MREGLQYVDDVFGIHFKVQSAESIRDSGKGALLIADAFRAQKYKHDVLFFQLAAK